MADITLRPYQSRAIHELFATWRAGYRSVVMVAPTGCGKRILALWLMDYGHKRRRKVLFVGDRRLLVTQAQADAEKFGIDHGIIMANAESGNAASGNQIASIHTLKSWYFTGKYSSEITGEGLPDADLVVIDECHKSPGDYRKLLKLYPEAKFLCLTATPVGPEGRSLVPGLYETLIEPVKNSELINNGFLLPTTVFAPSEPDITGVSIDGGKEYSQKALGKAVQSCTIFADVFKEWEAYQDKATVCFVPGIAFGRDIVNEYNFRMGSAFPRGKAAYLIEAKTPPEEREAIFEGIKAEGRGVVVSVDVLKEGWDCPVISCCIDLQPNSQLRTYWQKVGRIKRPYEGQTQAIYLDFAGNCWKFPHPDEDPEWPTGDFTTQDVIERRRVDKEEPKPIVCLKCGMMRKAGPVCPNCGHGGADSVRKVRMGDGSLVEIPFETKKRQEISEAQRAYNAWKGCLYGALAKGWTYAQCSRIYKAKTGQWPPGDWPGVYHNTSLDARRRPRDEFSKGELYKWLGEKSPV